MRVLRGRNVILFPDIDGYGLWMEKAKILRGLCKTIKISEALERYGTDEDRERQVDIADILLRDLPRIRSPGEEAKTERGYGCPGRADGHTIQGRNPHGQESRIRETN